MPKSKTETSMRDLEAVRTGWASVSKSEFDKIQKFRQRGGSVYAGVLDDFLKSTAEVWKKEGLSQSEVAGLQSQRSKDTYKGRLAIRTHQERRTKKGEPYKGTYTVFLVRGKET